MTLGLILVLRTLFKLDLNILLIKHHSNNLNNNNLAATLSLQSSVLYPPTITLLIRERLCYYLT